MNLLAALVWERPSLLVPALLVTAAVAAWLAFRYQQSDLTGAARWLAPVGKIVTLALLGCCLAEPLWSSQRVKPGANLFLLVADNSQSLSLSDKPGAASRGEQLKSLLTKPDAPWQIRLEQDFEVRRYSIDRPLKYVSDFNSLAFEGDRTPLAAALKGLRERLKDRPVAGVLLFTDGISTDAISESELAGLPPIYPVPIGAATAQRDLSIGPVAVSTTAFEDAPVTITSDLLSSQTGNDQATIQLLDEAGEEVQQQSVTVGNPQHPATARFQIRSKQTGVSFYRLQATYGKDKPSADEATRANNERLIAVDRGAGPYRILYVSGRPNWEYKFLQRSIENDDQLRMTAMIRIARREAKFDFRGRAGEAANPLFRGFDKVGEETERYDQPVIVRLNTKTSEELRDGFPKTAAALFEFHAVVIDDLEADFFKADQLALLERYVSERGGGLLMLGGQESFRQGGYQKTPLGRVLPVYLEAASTAPPATGYRLALTREGWLQPWARLRSTEPEEQRRLKEVTSLLTLNTVSGLKPGASSIAEVIDPQGQKQPAVVVHRFGQGRAAAMLIGDLWRWQIAQSDEQREKDDLGKAWRQLLRWLVVDVPERVTITPQTEPLTGEPLVKLEIRLRDPEFHPQDNAAVTVKVTTPEEGTIEQPAEPSLEEPGLYTLTVPNRPAGAWRAKVDAIDADGKPLGEASTGWVTESLSREFPRVTPDRELLERIAKATKGRVIEADAIDGFVSTLSAGTAPLTETTTSPLWHSPLVWLLITVGVCLEWGLRRRRGLA